MQGVRADRLVSLVLLLRQRGRLTAPELARELEVSTRTVLRDVEALSTAGVPVYAERGRHGGFALLPGFRTELTGLNDDEAVAMLATRSGGGGRALGLGAALASAQRKVVDALPDGPRSTATDAARRLLVEPEIDLLSRRQPDDAVPGDALRAVRRAVLAGRRLRIEYAAAGAQQRWRTVDPIGLVTVRGNGYLLATRDGADRTYRLSRITAAEQLDEPADRAEDVDLQQLWRQRSDRFRAGDDQLTVVLLVTAARRDDLLGTVVAVHHEQVDGGDGVGRQRLEVSFQDARHAEWALWQLAADAEVLQPGWLRSVLRERALAMAAGYRGSDEHAATGGADRADQTR